MANGGLGVGGWAQALAWADGPSQAAGSDSRGFFLGGDRRVESLELRPEKVRMRDYRVFQKI